MLSEQVVAAVLEHKARRRLWQYLVVLALQGFFVGAFLPVVSPPLALSVAVVGTGLGGTLAWLREQRRLLENSYQRVALEAAEAFVLLGLLAVSAVVASWLGVPLLQYQAHLSYALFGYFVGSLAGELGWRRRVFGQLPVREQVRYVQNLAPSLLLPYSWRHVRRLWSRSNQQKPDR